MWNHSLNPMARTTSLNCRMVTDFTVILQPTCPPQSLTTPSKWTSGTKWIQPSIHSLEQLTIQFLFLHQIHPGVLSFAWVLVLKMIHTHTRSFITSWERGLCIDAIFVASALNLWGWRMKDQNWMITIQQCSLLLTISKLEKKIFKSVWLSISEIGQLLRFRPCQLLMCTFM